MSLSSCLLPLHLSPLHPHWTGCHSLKTILSCFAEAVPSVSVPNPQLGSYPSRLALSVTSSRKPSLTTPTPKARLADPPICFHSILELCHIRALKQHIINVSYPVTSPALQASWGPGLPYHHTLIAQMRDSPPGRQMQFTQLSLFMEPEITPRAARLQTPPLFCSKTSHLDPLFPFL